MYMFYTYVMHVSIFIYMFVCVLCMCVFIYFCRVPPSSTPKPPHLCRSRRRPCIGARSTLSGRPRGSTLAWPTWFTMTHGHVDTVFRMGPQSVYTRTYQRKRTQYINTPRKWEWSSLSTYIVAGVSLGHLGWPRPHWAAHCTHQHGHSMGETLKTNDEHK